MRNLKKFLALVLATMMLLSVAVISTSAADEADYTDAAQHLAALQVMKGNENGDLMLDNGVTRYQAALFFVQALTGKTDVAIWNADKKSAHFSDVPEYGTAIDHAYGINLIKGRGNGVYGYNDPILYQDMLVMAVRALGYETEDMSYPYGHILAAQKLGLTDDVAQVNYKAALTRGETAQIIWNMLGTEIAVVDALTDKILYPGDTGLTDAILATNPDYVAPERVTLLEDSGLAGGKLETLIVDFVAADEDDEESFDTVELDNGLVLAAADFGITAETPWVSYMGLPVEIFISVDEEDFEQAAYDDGDATVVFANFAEYTTVTNLGDAGDIKYVASETAGKDYYSFGGTKFTTAKYDVETYTFGENGWVLDTTVDLTDFEYETKDGYVAEEGTTYAQVSYRVIEAETAGEKGTVEVLYTDFDFGQYNVRELNGNKYTVVGVYGALTENLDEEESYFVEYLVDKIGTSSAKVTSATKTISNTKGEKALNVTVEGEAVEAGDFMFYNYNAVDNILTVAMNCGGFETGRLTAQTAKTETVKISGTSYAVGFKGNFSADFASEFNSEANKVYIAALEAGKDNVKFIVVDGNVVYMEACSEVTNDSKFDFAVVTTDPEIMMDLLDITNETKYEAALTAGLYVEDGVVKVAMMDKTTGEWVLASVDTYAQGWVAEDEEFENEYDLATEAKYADLIGEDYKNADAVAAFADLVACGLVAVIDATDDVYTVAANEADFFVYGTADEYGISFSDNSTKTNEITADDEIDPARVELDAESVIIVVTATGAGSRVGVQKAENSYPVAAGYFLAASSDLIVLVETEAAGMDVAAWADAAAANSDENWYITTLDTGVEVEAGETEDDPYIVTITNVYDMKAEEVIASVQTEVENLADVLEIEEAGVVLFKNASDVITVEERGLDFVITEVANDNEDDLTYTVLGASGTGAAYFNWINADTIELVDDDNVIVDAVEPVDVNVKVITLNMVDTDTYDLEGVVSMIDWAEGDEENEYKVGDVTVKVVVDDVDAEGNPIKVDTEVTVWEYFLDTELVNEITEPTEGVLDQYILDYAAEVGFVVIPEIDNDDYALAEAEGESGAITAIVLPLIAYSVEDGVVNMVVYKLVFPVELGE